MVLGFFFFTFSKICNGDIFISLKITFENIRGLVHKNRHASPSGPSHSKKCNGRAVVKKQNIFHFSVKNSTEIS